MWAEELPAASSEGERPVVVITTATVTVPFAHRRVSQALGRSTVTLNGGGAAIAPINKGSRMLNSKPLTILLVVALLSLSCGGNVASDPSPTTNDHPTVISALRTIVTAEKVFRSLSAKRNFGSLQELVDAGLLESSYLDFEQDGYRIAVEVNHKDFTLRAEPLQPASDRIYFFCDQTGLIRTKTGSRADASSPPLSATNAS